jgi:hypothetical protein
MYNYLKMYPHHLASKKIAAVPWLRVFTLQQGHFTRFGDALALSPT